ncbi:hypothetical protein FRC04_009665 [Tulasnella sp. 424]|nr:hypothetical protein FRC04_009665 [Tulasnella sp. 424]KAG8975964.1 hypothetical protein FRC05_004895 [Tulasnella sp. 425]
MLKSFDPERAITVFRLPEPPVAPSSDESAPIIVHKVDWEAVGLSENEGKVAFIIDNALTPEDCQKLLKAREDSRRAVESGRNSWWSRRPNWCSRRGLPKIRSNFTRNAELADWILSKLRPYLPEEVLYAPASKYSQFGEDNSGREGARDEDEAKTKNENRVQLTRLNEQLKYLKYVRGDYFEPHYDGVYRVPEHSEISCLTLQLYLNGSKEDLEGGATQFSTYLTRDVVVEVDPRPGRALIFEQGNLRHCGAKVLKGEKYAIRTDLMYKKISTGGDEIDTV